ncbi:MAG TPA: YggS family pyridoxal phosphate-dependent enzyme [Dehalococcoidia bacterium]|nr:YggS family pyridoxal phosphate-dependent enzyme [Dehalococcoidia bacterium]
MPSDIQPATPAATTTDIAANLHRLHDRVDAACRRAGRSPSEVTIVGVSKGFPAGAVVAAWQAGLRDMGENRVQEAATKIALATAQGARPRWHLVGHLQTNKVKTALSLFDIIHSVDSLHLATAIDRAASRPVSVLLEVNVSGEASKYGLKPEEVEPALSRVRALPNIDVQGLMTVAPLLTDSEQARPVFRQLRELAQSPGLPQLSMGMSDDFEVAVEEGATMIRIGRAIFGPRLEILEEARPQTE